MLKLTIAIAIGILTLGYLVPTSVALVKEKRNTGAIFVLNILAGWTFVGWLIALVWAFTNDYGKTA